jgi:arsenite methyltransferase
MGLIINQKVFIFRFLNMFFMSVRLFKALADQTRVTILRALEERDICACEFTALTGKSQPTVSIHLGILRKAGLVKTRRDGKMIIYSLKDKHIVAFITTAERLDHV